MQNHILFDSLTMIQQKANFRIFTTSTMGGLNEAQRHHIYIMVEDGLSFCEEARKMDCSHQTIMKLVEREGRNATTGLSDRQCPGRLKVTSQLQDRNIVL